MTDYHVHIGQWFETYYDAGKVFSELKANGIDELWFSSTTSCRYCKESLAVQENIELQKNLPSARELYELIRFEIQEAISSAKKLGIRAHPLYWIVPEIHFSGAITLEQAMAELPYEGFKIHPRGNMWNLEDERTAMLAEKVFSYANSHEFLMLIHCGENDFELPTKFETFIANYPHCNVQLAHCRPLKETLYMLKKYPNVTCDSAFADEKTLSAIREAGFAEKIRYGSDFPIQQR